jgi:mRNA-degrading endonuclease RelE of RelBE toxin-antitoxin system
MLSTKWMDKINKFLARLSPQERKIWLTIITDVMAQKLTGYDVKPLQGYPGFSRLRKGKVRLIYKSSSSGVLIVAIDDRSDIYKQI